MQITLPEELKEWCYYDVKSFSWQLKKNAPEDIRKKFQEYKDRSLEIFDIEKEWNEYHKKT